MDLRREKMSVEILINVTPEETRVALVENGVLQEVFIERAGHHLTVGGLYKGKVLRVLPGMQSAFVDIGEERSAFLHVADMAGARQEVAAPVAVAANESAELPVVAPERFENIENLLKEGDEILVQVVKEALGNKGARLTTQISIPSRYLVFMPNLDHIGISVKIEDEVERERLKALIEQLRLPHFPGGYVLRTAGEGASEEALRRDMAMLNRVWQAIGQQAEHTAGGHRIHDDLPLVLRTLRDLVGPEVERIRIDSKQTHQAVSQFARVFLPDHQIQIEHYAGERPIFDLFGVDDEIQRALERKVPLKSGGYLVIDQTESMMTIDVNTGGYVGRRNLEETIFKTNLEAAQSIARQLRLRNLGGIIIIDFIDMDEEEHRRQVLRALEKALEKDSAKAKIHAVSPLGLVEMTRKRTRESLGRVLCEPCGVCGGRGYAKSVETVCFEINREIIRAVRQFDPREVLILASDAVVSSFMEDRAAGLAELEQFIGRPIRLRAQGMYHVEQYDVVTL